MNEVNKNTSPAISVIVPVYNAEKTLRQCVDSILAQDFKDFELLLIDDGSKDSSPTICDDYALQDSRVKVFHKPNGGVSSARNVGLDNAQGEWITFIDSDDYISPRYLNGICEHNEDVLLLHYVWVKGNNKIEDNRLEGYNKINNRIEITNFLNRYLTTMIFRAPSAMFLKLSLIADIRFCEKMKVGEDALFNHKLLLKVNTLYCFHDRFYYFRISEVEAEKKYQSDTSYAIASLAYLFESFKLICSKWRLNKGLFLSYYTYFKSICREDWRRKPSKWYRNKDVISFYEYLWPYLSLHQKIKHRFIRAISIFD